MPVPTNEIERQIEVLHKIHEVLGNQENILIDLAIKYLGEILSQSTSLTINYLPPLMKLIKEFFTLDIELPTKLEDSLYDILNSFKDKVEAEEFQIEIDECLDALEFLGKNGYEIVENA